MPSTGNEFGSLVGKWKGAEVTVRPHKRHYWCAQYFCRCKVRIRKDKVASLRSVSALGTAVTGTVPCAILVGSHTRGDWHLRLNT